MGILESWKHQRVELSEVSLYMWLTGMLYKLWLSISFSLSMLDGMYSSTVLTFLLTGYCGFPKGCERGPQLSQLFFSELDSAIASTGDRAKNFALKNQIYCEFSNSVACQVLIKQSSEKKKGFATFCPASFSQPLGKAQ